MSTNFVNIQEALNTESVPNNVFLNTVHEVQRNTKAPLDMVFLTGLAVVSSVCQHLIDVELPTGNVVPTSLMMILVADSGERKSTVDKILFSAIRKYEIDQLPIYERQLNEWKSNIDIIKSKLKGIARKISQLAAEGEDTTSLELELQKIADQNPAKPKKFKLLYENATPEAMLMGLSQDHPSVSLISSEGANILKSKAFRDFGKQNALWSGEDVIVDRVEGNSYCIKNARLTVFIMVQPSVLQSYLDMQGQHARGSGLLARSIMYQPLSTQGTRFIDSPASSWEHIHYFNNRVNQLLDDNVESAIANRKILRFSPEAKQAWINYFNMTEYHMNQNLIYSQAKDHASKLAENVGRVAALLHFFSGNDGDISIDILRMAMNTCHIASNYFVNKFHGPSQDQQDAFMLLSWINMYAQQNRLVPKNFIRQRGPNQLRDRDKLNKAINILVQNGLLSVVSDKKTKYLDRCPNLPPLVGYHMTF